MDKKIENSGGLYAKINMSVRTANIMVSILVILLVTVSAFIIRNSGFTVSFDTNGGSYIEPVKAKHSDLIHPSDPVKEGWHFSGWYTDRGCTQKWDPAADAVTGSMTLYAGWSR